MPLAFSPPPVGTFTFSPSNFVPQAPLLPFTRYCGFAAARLLVSWSLEPSHVPTLTFLPATSHSLPWPSAARIAPAVFSAKLYL